MYKYEKHYNTMQYNTVQYSTTDIYSVLPAIRMMIRLKSH